MRRCLTLSKAIATDKMSKKIIVPVSKKLIAEVCLSEQRAYACYFKDGLLIVGEPPKGLNDSIFEQGRDKGYWEGHEDGYDEGYHDGKEEAFLRGYRMGFDDVVDGYGYRDFTKCDCGIDCDYDCRDCRFNPKKNKGGYWT